MRRNKFSFQIFCTALFIFSATLFVSAQKPDANRAVLIKFEKNIEQGNFSAIERELLDYAIAHPTDAKSFELLGKLRAGQNRLAEAKSLYQKSLSLAPDAASVKINLAVVNSQLGNRADALALLNQIGDKDLNGDAPRLQLARAFALLGDCEKALRVAEKLGEKIKNSDALPIRAGCYLAAGDKQNLLALLPAAKSAARQNPSAALNFASVLSDGEMYDQAATIARSILTTAPDNFDALTKLAKSEIYLKDFINAKTHLAAAAKINPNSSELFFVQSLFESVQGNQAKSLELMEKSLAANPNSTVVLSQYVIAAMRSNQAAKASNAAEKLLAINPNEPSFVYLRGAAALQSNDLSAAETSLVRFAELRPNDSRGCLALGLTFAAQPEKIEAARQQLTKCVALNPADFEANYQLGLSYKTQGETARAIQYLEAATRNAPEYWLALRDLGASYLQTGDEAKAKIVLEKAVALAPDDAETHFQLSRLYNLTGEKDLARKHLEAFQKLKNPAKSGM